MARRPKAAVPDPDRAAVKRGRRRKAAGEDEMIADVQNSAAAGSDDRVCVACNLPRGIEYRLPGGRVARLAGSWRSPAALEGGGPPLSGGYGLTMVDRESWELVVKLYGDSAAFKAGLIYAAKTEGEAAAEAKSRGDVTHGDEPVALED
jgi:hypothetical protein